MCARDLWKDPFVQTFSLLNGGGGGSMVYYYQLSTIIILNNKSHFSGISGTFQSSTLRLMIW